VAESRLAAGPVQPRAPAGDQAGPAGPGRGLASQAHAGTGRL